MKIQHPITLRHPVFPYPLTSNPSLARLPGADTPFQFNHAHTRDSAIETSVSCVHIYLGKGVSMYT